MAEDAVGEMITEIASALLQDRSAADEKATKPKRGK